MSFEIPRIVNNGYQEQSAPPSEEPTEPHTLTEQELIAEGERIVDETPHTD